MAEQIIATDTFTRTVASGWGAAETGGPWSGIGSYANPQYLSVADGRGVQSPPNGGGGTSALATAAATALRVEGAVTLGFTPGTGDAYVGVEPRTIGASNYRAYVWLRSSGEVWLLIQKNGANLATLPVAAPAWTNGATYRIKTEAVGTSAVAVRAKIWADGATEPGWQLTSNDAATGALAGPGGPGLYSYRSGSATTAGSFSWDNLTATNLDAPEPVTAPPMRVGTKRVTAIYVGNASANTHRADV